MRISSKNYPRVPVIVRREYHPEWGPIKHCIYLIVYTKNRITPKGALYVGRFKEYLSRPNFRLGFPYVGSGSVLEDLGLKLQERCTLRDLLYHAQWIDHIQCWYCSPEEYKSSESEAIRYFAQTYGIPPLVLQHFEVNDFTRQFVRPDGLLLNCQDNGFQQGRASLTVDVLSESGFIGGTSSTQARRSTDRYAFSELGLESLSQKISQQLVNGKIPPVPTVFYFQGIAYIVSVGVRACARKASEITGIYMSQSTLSQSLKRHYGDTIYKGIHFKYASLLTEEELKNAIAL